MAIEIKDDQLTKIMAQAVLTFLTPEKREELLLQAVTEFFTAKDKSGYDKRPEIEKAFSEVIGKVGREVAMEIIKSDETIMAKIRAEAHAGINKVLDSNKLSEHIAGNFARSVGLSSLL